MQLSNPPEPQLEPRVAAADTRASRLKRRLAGKWVLLFGLAASILLGSSILPAQSANPPAVSAAPARKHVRHRHRRRRTVHPATAAAPASPAARPPAANAGAPAPAKPPAGLPNTSVAHATAPVSSGRRVVARAPVTTSNVVRGRIGHVHIVQGPNTQATAPPNAVTTVTMPPVTEPPAPKWPAFDHPASANVIWDSHGLSIQATNSSLKQILRDVATDTGVKIEGFGSDERVFGAYGPGLARDVLSEVLQGSGYNVIMIGDLGQGAPRRMILSARQASNPAAGAASARQQSADGDEGGDDSSDDQSDPEPPQDTQPMRPGFQPGGPPRTPQQIMQEMQQRQLQMQQEQELEQQQQLQQQQPEQPQPDQQPPN